MILRFRIKKENHPMELMLSDGFLVLLLFKQVSLYLLLKGLYLWQLALV